MSDLSNLINRLRENAEGEGIAIFAEAADALAEMASKLADALVRIAELEKPIDMILHCPACLEQHIDEATETWPNEPHRSHLCLADVATNGVAEIKTKGKDDMVLIDGPLEVMRQIRMRDAAQPKLDWEGDRP